MITEEQLKNLKTGDEFYTVFQKDNSPFEKPFIRKLKVVGVQQNPLKIVSNKIDKLGRHYIFGPKSICLSYGDALIDKQKILIEIAAWELFRKEQDRIYFEEQKRKEKLEKEKYEKEIRANEREKVFKELEDFIDNWKTFDNFGNEIITYRELNGIRTQPTLYEKIREIEDKQ